MFRFKSLNTVCLSVFLWLYYVRYFNHEHNINEQNKATNPLLPTMAELCFVNFFRTTCNLVIEWRGCHLVISTGVGMMN